MVVALLLSLALSQEIDPQKFDCDKQCEDIRQMCLLSCQQEIKHAKKEHQPTPMDCDTMCATPSDRCKEMCKEFKQNKAKMGKVKQSDIDAADGE